MRSGACRAGAIAAAVLSTACGTTARTASVSSAALPCAALTPPARQTTAPVQLPSAFTAALIGGIVVDEVLIGANGVVSGIRPVRERVEGLAPFAERSIRDSKFLSASIDGHPVVTRLQVETTLGTVAKARVEPEYDLLWANVPGGQSREAAWQLAGSVTNLMLTAHAGTKPSAGGEIVARAADGREKLLLKVPASEKPVDVRETISTGKFFEKAGDYRLELRSGEKTLAWTTVTIADDYTRAIVNACKPI